jgi:hypothetical protein
MGGITHITTGAITTHIAITGTTICTGAGLSASMGARDIIAIGKQIVARTDAHHSLESTASHARSWRRI